MEAIENAQQKLHEMHDAFLWNAVEADLGTRKIVDMVAYNFYEPEQPKLNNRTPGMALSAVGVLGTRK